MIVVIVAIKYSIFGHKTTVLIMVDYNIGLNLGLLYRYLSQGLPSIVLCHCISKAVQNFSI